MAASSSAIRAGRAFVEVFADDSKLAKGLHSAEKKLKAFGQATREIGTKMMAVGAAITAPLAASAHAFVKAGSQMAEMSERTGATVEALSALKFAAAQSDVEIEELEKGLRKMQRTIYQAAGGSHTANLALTRLGISVSELSKLEPDQQFRRIAEALSKVEDPAVRTGLAMEIFGRSGTMMLPMMAQGAAGLDKMASEAARLGLVMSTQDAQGARNLERRMSVLTMVLGGVRNAVGSALVPTMTDLAQKMIGAGAAVAKWVRQHKELVVQVFRTGGIIIGVGGALVGLGYAFEGLSKGVGMLAGYAPSASINRDAEAMSRIG